jgi:hypothetical protein
MIIHVTIKGQEIKLTEAILILILFNEIDIQDFKKMRNAKNILPYIKSVCSETFDLLKVAWPSSE